MQAVIADPRQKRGIGIEQSVKPVDQHADRYEVEQHPVAPGLAARRRFGLRQPLRGFCRRSGRYGRLDHIDNIVGGVGHIRYRRRAGLALEPRRQLPGELVEGAVFHRGQDRRFRFADRAKRQDVLERFGSFHGRFQIGLV